MPSGPSTGHVLKSLDRLRLSAQDQGNKIPVSKRICQAFCCNKLVYLFVCLNCFVSKKRGEKNLSAKMWRNASGKFLCVFRAGRTPKSDVNCSLTHLCILLLPHSLLLGPGSLFKELGLFHSAAKALCSSWPQCAHINSTAWFLQFNIQLNVHNLSSTIDLTSVWEL